jgi:hypothetical protein
MCRLARRIQDCVPLGVSQAVRQRYDMHCFCEAVAHDQRLCQAMHHPGSAGTPARCGDIDRSRTFLRFHERPLGRTGRSPEGPTWKNGTLLTNTLRDEGRSRRRKSLGGEQVAMTIGPPSLPAEARIATPTLAGGNP